MRLWKQNKIFTNTWHHVTYKKKMKTRRTWQKITQVVESVKRENYFSYLFFVVENRTEYCDFVYAPPTKNAWHLVNLWLFFLFLFFF